MASGMYGDIAAITGNGNGVINNSEGMDRQ